MIDAQKLLGVDVMTGHWEFITAPAREGGRGATSGKIDFVAQNVKTADFGDQVSVACHRTIGSVPVASSARRFRTRRSRRRPEWTFGIRTITCSRSSKRVQRRARRRAAVTGWTST
jgi:sulfur-oxidizing protein SoxB